MPCSGAVFVGPFSFKKDPERLALAGKAKSVKGEQVCVGGEWVDGAGKFVAVAGLGCPEGDRPAESEVSIEYTPSSGGAAANPIYLSVKFAEKLPANCATANITLSLK